MHKGILAELRAKNVCAETITEVERLLEAEASRKAKDRARQRRHRDALSRDATMSRDCHVTAEKVNDINKAVTLQPLLVSKKEKEQLSATGIPPVYDGEKDLFLRGRQVLGDKAGGLIKKLLVAKKSVELARAVIEQAATKGSPREWVGAVLRAIEKERTEYRWTDHLAL